MKREALKHFWGLPGGSSAQPHPTRAHLPYRSSYISSSPNISHWHPLVLLILPASFSGFYSEIFYFLFLEIFVFLRLIFETSMIIPTDINLYSYYRKKKKKPCLQCLLIFICTSFISPAIITTNPELPSALFPLLNFTVTSIVLTNIPSFQEQNPHYYFLSNSDAQIMLMNDPGAPYLQKQG